MQLWEEKKTTQAMNGDVERVFRNKQSNIHSIILLADLMLAVNEMKKKTPQE